MIFKNHIVPGDFDLPVNQSNEGTKMIINIKNGFSSGHLMQEKSRDM